MSFWNAMNRTSFSHRWIDVDGNSTRVVEAGDPDNDSTVVFLHGIGGHIETFCHNIAAHAERHRVVSFDLIGHGYSAKPEGLYEIERYIDQTMRLFDIMKIEKPVLAGTSLGGWIFARIAARYPDRVSRLSLISSAGLTAHPSVMKNLKELTERASLMSGKEAVRMRLDFVIKNKAALTDELIDVRHDIYAAEDYKARIKDVMCLQNMEIRQRNLLQADELAKIEAPTLVVWTREDPTATLDDGLKYANSINDSRFVLFDNSSHLPQLEEHERFNELHMRFIDDPASVISSEVEGLVS